MKTLSQQEKSEIFDFNKVTKVDKKSEAYDAIENHFGTLKCNSDDYEIEEGELWCVYPPSGVYGETLYLLIKTKQTTMKSIKQVISENEITNNKDLCEYLDLDYEETTVGNNGYPSGLNWAMTSDSIQELLDAKKSLEEEGYEVEDLLLRKKDGHQLWNRRQDLIEEGHFLKNHTEDFYIDLDYSKSAKDLTDEVKEFWLGDEDQINELANEAVADGEFESVKEAMDDLNKEVKDFINDAGSEGVVRVFVGANDLKHIDYTVTEDQASYSHDSTSYQLAIRVVNL